MFGTFMFLGGVSMVRFSGGLSFLEGLGLCLFVVFVVVIAVLNFDSGAQAECSS